MELAAGRPPQHSRSESKMHDEKTTTRNHRGQQQLLAFSSIGWLCLPPIPLLLFLPTKPLNYKESWLMWHQNQCVPKLCPFSIAYNFFFLINFLLTYKKYE
jgi:hypothetical protein